MLPMATQIRSDYDLAMILFKFEPCMYWIEFDCDVITRYGSVLILGCELSAGDVIIVFLSVINGSFALGNALPKLQAFATALGSAAVVFDIIDRVK